MAKKEHEIVQSIQNFDNKLLKAKRRLIKSIDLDGEIGEERMNVLIRKELIFDRRRWSISKNQKILSFSTERTLSIQTITNAVKEKIMVLRGEDYSLVEIWTLEDGGYYTDIYILENKKEI